MTEETCEHPDFAVWCEDCIERSILAAEARGRERGIEEAARPWREAVNKARAWKEARSPCIFLYYPGHRCDCENCAPLRALLSAEPQATPPSLPEQREDRQTDRQEMATSPLEKIGTRAAAETPEET